MAGQQVEDHSCFYVDIAGQSSTDCFAPDGSARDEPLGALFEAEYRACVGAAPGASLEIGKAFKSPGDLLNGEVLNGRWALLPCFEISQRLEIDAGPGNSGPGLNECDLSGDVVRLGADKSLKLLKVHRTASPSVRYQLAKIQFQLSKTVKMNWPIQRESRAVFALAVQFRRLLPGQGFGHLK